MRLLVSGSRTFSDRESMYKVLDELLRVHLFTTVIHGAARGADKLADEWAYERRLPVERFKADWNKYGKKAGFVRNQRMLDEGRPHLVFAFVDKLLEESKGTAMMVRLAESAGVKVRVFDPSTLPEELHRIASIMPKPKVPPAENVFESSSHPDDEYEWGGGWYAPPMDGSYDLAYMSGMYDEEYERPDVSS